MAMNTKGGRRRAKRRAARKDFKEARKEAQYLGGSKGEEQALYREAREGRGETRAEAKEGRGEIRRELETSRGEAERYSNQQEQDRWRGQLRDEESRGGITRMGDEARRAENLLGQGAQGAMGEYTQGAQQALGARSRALGTNALTGSAENILQQRAAQIGATPTIGQAIETNIGANTANANQQLARSTQMLNRQAMGLAAGQGEGGALAMQQAMANSGVNAADMAAQKNMMLGDQAAQLRLQAALTQREQDLAEAGYASDARMQAAAQERASQLTFAGQDAASLEAAAANRAQAGLGVSSAQAQLATQAAQAQQTARANEAQRALAANQLSGTMAQNAQGQRGALATNLGSQAGNAAANDQNYLSNMIGAKYQAQQGQATNQKTVAEKIPIVKWFT